MPPSDPTPEQLTARLTRLPALAVAGLIAYRSSTPPYATEADLVSGEGSRRHGGRWNPVGVAAVYASLTPETALAETLAHNRYNGVPVADAMPRTFVALRATLQAVLDLRSGPVRRRVGVSLRRLLTTDRRKEAYAGRVPITQAVGRAAVAADLEGLLVPSAADPGGCNLVVFRVNLRPKSKVRVLNPDRLTK